MIGPISSVPCKNGQIESSSSSLSEWDSYHSMLRIRIDSHPTFVEVAIHIISTRAPTLSTILASKDQCCTKLVCISFFEQINPKSFVMNCWMITLSFIIFIQELWPISVPQTLDMKGKDLGSARRYQCIEVC